MVLKLHSMVAGLVVGLLVPGLAVAGLVVFFPVSPPFLVVVAFLAVPVVFLVFPSAVFLVVVGFLLTFFVAAVLFPFLVASSSS